MKNSREALESFLKLNMFILHVKKFQSANSEATRKILKKHAKRTALQLPDTTDHDFIIQSKSLSLPRILVQAIGEIILPVIPPLDDYACLICTNIAFKPDWFPLESKQKLKDNEKEAAREEMLELGIDPEQGCRIM
ncbi:hypothetical protein F5146DRAFT_1010306 [Armillaria mellea]|nr:hypothetical protein F5146DRAFT_1010306 [Armillaria mellea]